MLLIRPCNEDVPENRPPFKEKPPWHIDCCCNVKKRQYYQLQGITPSGPFYLAQVRMTRSPRLHFDHSFALYYIIYAYKLIII
jgi:hypothetical protein